LARPAPNLKAQVFINPEIVWRSKEPTNGVPGRKNNLEGCLSIPGYYGLVRRQRSIKLKYQTIHPSRRQADNSKFTGFLATVIQHEYDHLNGVLFIDRVLQQGGKLYRFENKEMIEIIL